MIFPRCLLACLIALPLLAQEPPVEKDPPPARTEYMGREVAQTMHWKGASWLLRKTREREESAQEMLRELKLEPGMTVCDLGCGNGYHALEMARSVEPGGKVIGVDIQKEMLDMLMKRAARGGITNIVPVLGEFHDPNLKPDTCDLVLIVDAYHEFSHPELMLQAIRRALKPDGVAVLVEFRAEDESVPIKPEHKMSKDQINREMKANGFVLVRQYDELPWQHLMFFGRKKPEQ